LEKVEAISQYGRDIVLAIEENRVMNVMSRVITQTREAPSAQSGWKRLSKPSGLYMNEGYLESPDTLLSDKRLETLRVKLY